MFNELEASKNLGSEKKLVDYLLDRIDAIDIYNDGKINWDKFKEIKTIEYKNFNYEQLKNYIEELNKDEKGCILEVDLKYPNKLHNEHNDFPFCPQNVKINKQKVSKLTNTLYDKEKYVIHYRNLIQTIKHGLKFKKIHKILNIRESNWMES